MPTFLRGSFTHNGEGGHPNVTRNGGVGPRHRSLSTSPSRTTLAASDPGVDHPQIPGFLGRNRQDDAVRPENRVVAGGLASYPLFQRETSLEMRVVGDVAELSVVGSVKGTAHGLPLERCLRH